MLTIKIFGTLSITQNGKQEKGFRGDRSKALLVWLLLEGDKPIRREYLASLFFSESPEAQARISLRTNLFRLRKAIAGSLDADILDITRKTIQLSPTALDHLHVDALEFEQLQNSDQLPDLLQALSLYQGELLTGFHLNNSEGFYEWLLLRREQFHTTYLKVAERVLALLTQRHELETLISVAEQLLQHDVWHEGAHRALMWAYAQRGERDIALAHYRKCEQLLLETLSVEPSAETIALYEQIKSGTLKAPTSLASNLPDAVTPIFGREADIRTVSNLLDEHRLITIVGMGGIGKTRLAIEAARQQEGRYRDGVWFVSLADAPSHGRDRLLTAMAEVLQLHLRGSESASGQISRWLASRQLLIVLDNLEDLLDEVSILARLLAQAKDVRLLCTSREALGLRAEVRFVLKGVALAGAELFVERARRIVPHFAPDSAEIATIQQICKHLGGIPLAIELAASGVRRRTVADIAKQLRKSLKILRSRQRDIPARQRSLQHVLTESWERFEVEDRPNIARLAIFQGAFTDSAISTVMDSDGEMIDDLLDAYWLQRTDGGRFRLHPVIRQFLTTQLHQLLDDPAITELKVAYSHYYLQRLIGEENALVGKTPHLAAQKIKRDLENIHGAWRTACEQSLDGLLQAAAEPLSHYHSLVGTFASGQQLLMLAREAVTNDPDLTAWLSLHHVWLLDSVKSALDVAREAVTLAQQTQTQAYANYVLGAALRNQFMAQEAAKPLNQAILLAHKLEDERLLGLAKLARGRVHLSAGETTLARHCFDEATAHLEKNGDRRSLAQCLRSKGVLLSEEGDIYGELVLYQEAQQLTRSLGDRAEEAFVTGNIAIWYSEQGEHTLAREQFQRASKIFRDLQMPGEEAWIQFEYATNEVYLGEFVHAQAAFEQLAMPKMVHYGEERGIFDGLAMVARSLGRYSLALSYLMRFQEQAQEDVQLDNYAYWLLDVARVQNDMGAFAEANQALSDLLSRYETASLLYASLQHELGMSWLGLGQLDKADKAFERAATLHSEADIEFMAAENNAGRLRCGLGSPTAASPVVSGTNGSGQAETILPSILTAIEKTPDFFGTTRPFWIYQTVLDYLMTENDPRFQSVATAARGAFERQLAKLTDPAMHTDFVQNVAWNRDIEKRLKL